MNRTFYCIKDYRYGGYKNGPLVFESGKTYPAILNDGEEFLNTLPEKIKTPHYKFEVFNKIANVDGLLSVSFTKGEFRGRPNLNEYFISIEEQRDKKLNKILK